MAGEGYCFVTCWWTGALRDRTGWVGDGSGGFGCLEGPDRGIPRVLAAASRIALPVAYSPCSSAAGLADSGPTGSELWCWR